MPGPLPPNPTTPVEAAAQQAVAAGTHTSPAQTLAGTLQTAAQTTPGALVTTTGHNVAFAGIGNVATDDPGIPAFAWVVTLIVQGAKNSRFINQDRHKWLLIPMLAFVVLVAYFALSSHGDWFTTLANATKNTGLVAANAIANYHTVKPLGWFQSAAEMS